MKKRAFFTFMGVLLLAGMLTAGFVDSALAEKTINLRFAHFLPPVSARQKRFFEPWIKMIEKRTKGKVKITIYPAGSLLKAPEIYDGVINNVAQIGFADIEGAWGRFPRTGVVTLPMAPWDKNVRTADSLLWKMFKDGYISDDYKQVKVLALIAAPPQVLNSRNKPVRTMEDLKGLKVALAQKGLSEALEKMGAIPANISAPDHYMALQKGTVDASMFSWVGMAIFKIAEVTKYHNDTGFAIGPLGIVMNKQTYDSFPPDVKKVFDDLSGDWLSKFDADVGTQINQNIKKAIRNTPGQEIYELSPKEEAKWRAVCEEVWKSWVKGADAKGLPGKKLLNEALRISKEYNGWSLK